MRWLMELLGRQGGAGSVAFFWVLPRFALSGGSSLSPTRVVGWGGVGIHVLCALRLQMK